MIGKVARMMAGRSVARKLGYSAGTGAIVGLLAPYAIKKILSLAGKAGKAAAEARRQPVEPEYRQHLDGIEIGRDRH